MKSRWIDDPILYKKSAALFAAIDSGLFTVLREQKGLTLYALKDLGWTPDYTLLLCLYLEGEGYLQKKDGKWSLSDAFEKKYHSFMLTCKHERNLYERWITPQEITKAVRAVYPDSRTYDQKGFRVDEKVVYDALMYTDTTDIIALYLLRKLPANRPLKLLEYGRSKGRMTEKLAKKIAVHNTICEQTQEIEFLKDSFDVIFMMNTVHYLSAEAFSKRITEMKQMLKKGGLLCIADVFYQNDTVFHSTVLLDWLTHGGIHHLFLDETCKELRACGYGEIGHQFIENIFIHLIYAYPSGASGQVASLC